MEDTPFATFVSLFARDHRSMGAEQVATHWIQCESQPKSSDDAQTARVSAQLARHRGAGSPTDLRGVIGGAAEKPALLRPANDDPGGGKATACV
jgi:hypothetical protein